MASNSGNSDLPALDLNAVIQVLLVSQTAARQLMFATGLACMQALPGLPPWLRHSPPEMPVNAAPSDGCLRTLTTTDNVPRPTSNVSIRTTVAAFLYLAGMTV